MKEENKAALQQATGASRGGASKTSQQTMPAVRNWNFYNAACGVRKIPIPATHVLQRPSQHSNEQKGVAGLVLMQGVVFAFDAPPSPY